VVGVVQVRASQGRRGRDTGSYADRGERREVRAWAARTVKRLLWTLVGPGLADTYPPRHHYRLAREAFEAVELRSTSWALGRHRVVRVQSRINTAADILRVLFRCGYFSLDTLLG
jgi:hypothetical protein